MGDANKPQRADGDALGLMHAAVLSSISLFDQKCAVLLTFDSAGAVFCIGSITGFAGGVTKAMHLQLFADWLLLLTAVSFLLSALFAFAVVRPRTMLSSTDPLFWGAWPSAGRDENFTLPIVTITSERSEAAKTRHIGLLGDICRFKAKHFKWALRFAFVGFAMLMGIELMRFWPSETSPLTVAVQFHAPHAVAITAAQPGH